MYNKKFLQSFQLNPKNTNPFLSSKIIAIAVKQELHPKVVLSDNSFKQFHLKLSKLRTKERENTKKVLAKAKQYLKSDTKKYYQEIYFVSKTSVPTRRQARQEVLGFLKQFPPVAI